MRIQGHPCFISISFFLIAASPGCWIPVLSNVLEAEGWSPMITWAFVVPPIAGVLSPLLLAARADRQVAAERLLGGIVLAGASFLYLAFREIEIGERPGRFLFFLGLNALITAPAWSLLNSVTFRFLGPRGHAFGLFRVWGTVGWMAAGWMVSFLGVDASPVAGKIAAGFHVVAGLSCLMLPHTPPSGKVARSWLEASGLSALGLLRERDLAVFLATSLLFSMPLAAFYMFTPVMLRSLGWEATSAGMTLGQMTEVVAMLVMGPLMQRLRIKWLFLLALGSAIVRYAFYSGGAHTGLVWLVLTGVAFHGICWTYFFEAGRLFLDRRVPTEYRSQIQALMGLLTAGAGTIGGTFMSGHLHRTLVQGGGESSGWTVFWLVLTGICLVCGLLFAVGYRGRKEPE